MNMAERLYQIVETEPRLNHAGSKATADIAKIAGRIGFQNVMIHMDSDSPSRFAKFQRQVVYFRDWRKAGKEIPDHSIVLLQHPFHHRQLIRNKTLYNLKERGVRFICLKKKKKKLRAFRYNDYYEHEFQTMMDLADVIIVHNNVMKGWFIKQGFDPKRLVTLQIFDYLQGKQEYSMPHFDRSLNIAGNLDTIKCKYISQLGQIAPVKVNLFGPNFNEDLKKYANINYHGSFPADEIPYRLTDGFGLVWDGDSIDGCKGKPGQYLRFNNPHKLSLYLSSGLPVVIWSKAAEADFVIKNKVGICVDSLYQLQPLFDSITESDYQRMCQNVRQVRKNLISGHYGKTALRSALEMI